MQVNFVVAVTGSASACTRWRPLAGDLGSRRPTRTEGAKKRPAASDRPFRETTWPLGKPARW